MNTPLASVVSVTALWVRGRGHGRYLPIPTYVTYANLRPDRPLPSEMKWIASLIFCRSANERQITLATRRGAERNERMRVRDRYEKGRRREDEGAGTAKARR